MYTQMLTSKKGGELISFKVNGEEKIHQGEQCMDENGKIYWKRHSPVLFPIVGKLKKNQTLIGGRTYELMQHGFARDLEFEPLTKLDNFHSYMLKSNKYTLSRYPYDFELYTTYRIDENKLTTIYKVINTGITNMPFGIGGHPAFKIDIEQLKKGNYYLEFEEKEEKYNSPIAQGGTNVSGGQKQRLSIARAIAKNPKIFLFDDSFSALDYKTDVALRKKLNERVKDATVLIVAQRISTILHADKIIVLEEGRIAGIGTHEELLAGCETYQEIASSQLSEAELKGGVR